MSIAATCVGPACIRNHLVLPAPCDWRLAPPHRHLSSSPVMRDAEGRSDRTGAPQSHVRFTDAGKGCFGEGSQVVVFCLVLY